MSHIATEEELGLPYTAIAEALKQQGFEQRVTERKRELEAAKQARENEGAVWGKDLQMRKIAAIPLREYYEMQHKYGLDCFSHREFQADLKKHMPHLTTVHCASRAPIKAKFHKVYQ